VQKETAARSFPVVCVGGSAGGLDAYKRLLKCLPPDLGAAIVTRDENGTHAELTLMPPAAMAPMPEAPFLNDPALSDASNYKPMGAQTGATQGQ
jgi:hypothetical protein